MIPIDRSAAFNPQTALQRIGGDEALLRDLAAFYIEDAPTLVGQVKQAISSQDAGSVMHAAHTLKSLSANLDAHQAMTLAELVERAGRAGDVAMAANLQGDLEAAVNAVITGLRSTYNDLK